MWRDETKPSTPERLAYWYFGLNGFLLLENFVIHSDPGPKQRTEADLLGVRFRYRRELLDSPMEDDPTVSDCPTLCNVIVAEVKRGACELNGPWTDPQEENMHRVLRAIGRFDDDVTAVAAEVVTCRLFACGNREGPLTIPAVPQILFGDMIVFIHARLRKSLKQKSSVGNWALDGRCLRALAGRHREFSEFERTVRQYFNLPRAEENMGPEEH